MFLPGFPIDGFAQWQGPINIAAKCQRNVFYVRPEGKYNRVQRAYPYPDRGEAGCKWTVTYTAGGRRVLVPVTPIRSEP